MLNTLRDEIHQTAVEHGGWDKPPSFGEVVALCHSELSEALEAYRAEDPLVWYKCTKYPCGNIYSCDDCYTEHDTKPEGIAVEMADCIIRILDWAGNEGIDMDAVVRAKMEYNKTRSYRHGGKKL